MIGPVLLFRFTEFVEKDEALLESTDYTNATLVILAYFCFEFVQQN